jgi:hypothetical protein
MERCAHRAKYCDLLKERFHDLVTFYACMAFTENRRFDGRLTGMPELRQKGKNRADNQFKGAQAIQFIKRGSPWIGQHHQTNARAFNSREIHATADGKRYVALPTIRPGKAQGQHRDRTVLRSPKVAACHIYDL